MNWKSNQTPATCDIDQDWRDYTGCNTINEYMASGNYTVSPASAFVNGTKDEEFTTKWTQTTKCITTYSWNAIYAESDEEYEQIVAEMIEQANAYYYQDCLEWSKEQAQERYMCELAVR